MILDADRISHRDKSILTGLFFSKYSRAGLKRLGFQSFAEAYNAIGLALESQPASIKNYRDEFDPLFPNGRKGWHNRPIRTHCQRVFEEYSKLDFDSFAGLVRSFVKYDENAWSATDLPKNGSSSGFASRLITGLAAERYFQTVQSGLPEFKGYAAEDVTQLGCGFDFKLSRKDNGDFLAVEVKGLRDQSGSVQLTPKEYENAKLLRDRFFLFVVKNFRVVPFHEIFPDPLFGKLQFARTERVTVEVSWLTRI